METESYLSYIYRGASPAYSKIRNDTFRTLTTDPLFRRRVSEASLIRLLNAVAWKLQDTKAEREQDQPAPGLPAVRHSLPVDAQPSRPRTSMPSMGMGMGAGPGPGAEPDSSPLSKSRARTLTITTEGSESSTLGPGAGLYVQGMNVLAAPFLYAARSESEAFVALYQLITVECPGYVRGAMSGVHKGLKLMDKVLAICDPKLSLFLVSKGLFAELYAFPSVLTLCACTPPLPEVMRLWDFLFAYGPHLNILCIVAQLVIVRSEIMSSPK
jgi:cell cycle arrest protein BUB2